MKLKKSNDIKNMLNGNILDIWKKEFINTYMNNYGKRIFVIFFHLIYENHCFLKIYF